MKFINRPISIAVILLFNLSRCYAADSAIDKAMTSWETLEATASFSINTPPDSQHIPKQGLDSIVGLFKMPTFELAYDYGLYSPTLSKQATYQKYSIQEITIAGRKARIIRAYEPSKSNSKPWLTGLYIANVKSVPVLGKIKLSLFGWLNSEEDYAISELIFKSINITD